MTKKHIAEFSLNVSADLICGGEVPDLGEEGEMSPTWLQLIRPHVYGEAHQSGTSKLMANYKL
jgi:hypothetical protein